MSISVLCPDGHPVQLDESRLGEIVACPRCFATFYAETPSFESDYARAEKGRARPSRDDDDDDDEDEDDDEDDRPVKKKPAKPVKGKQTKKKIVDDDDDDEEEEEKPRKRKLAKSRADDDDDDEDDDEDEEDDEDEGPLTRKQQDLKMVQLGLSMIMWAVICFAFLPLAAVGQTLLIAFALVADTPWLIYITLGLTGTSVFAIDVLMLIGVSFGFWAPKNAEVRSTIFGNMAFGALMLLFGGLGLLGVSNLVVADPEVSRRFGLLCFGMAGLCELIFFLTTMVYLKKIASFLKDMLLASEPINLLIEFVVWYVVPQVLDLVIGNWTNQYRELDALSYIAVGLFSLFYLFAAIRSYFLIIRWVVCVARIRDLVEKTIKDM